MAISKEFLKIIARVNPAIFDAIFPHGPAVRVFNRASAVALNPQPLPPHEIGSLLASEFVQAVWFANRFGLDQATVFAELDDWCPTRPKKIKLPSWWPPIPEPDPEPDWLSEMHLGFAAKLAILNLDEDKLGESINWALDRSLAVIEKLNG